MSKILKVLTYNIHKGFSATNFRFVLHEIRDAIASTDVDLVFLQEIQGEHEGHEKRVEEWPDAPQLDFLAEELWPHSAYGKNAIYRKGHHGNAILSKHPFTRWENIDLSKYRRSSRSLLHGVLEINDAENNTTQTLHAICIHFALFKTERKKQLDALVEHIEAHVPHDEPLIIAGDFNDWREEAEHHLESDLNIQEIFKTLQGHHAKTFPAWNPKLAVDRIYYRGITEKSCQNFNELPWRKLSDHTPLYAEFLI